MANWKVVGFEVSDKDGLPKVCVKAAYEVSKSYGHKHGFATGQVTLADPDVSAFVAYDDIAEDLAVSWVKAALGESGVANIEAQVQTQIDKSPDVDPAIAPPWEHKSLPVMPKKGFVE